MGKREYRFVLETLEARTLLAAAVGDVWQRSLDWTIRPAGDVGTTNGNPDDDAKGNPVWQYQSVPLGQGLGQTTTGGQSPNPWFAGSPTSLTWDDAWFGQAGGWTGGNDASPLIQQNIAVQGLYNQPIPLIRWKNPVASDMTVALSGTLSLSWTKYSGAEMTYPIDFVMMLQKPDGSLSPLVIANRKPAAFPKASGETADIPTILVDVPAVKVPAGGSIFYTFRYEDAVGRSGWVTLDDHDLKITCKALTAAPLAGNDTAVTNQNRTVNTEVLLNDRWDPQVLPQVALLKAPAHGSATVRPDQSIDYIPANGFVGIDTLTYLLSDGVNTTTATLSVTVQQPYTLYVSPGGHDANSGDSWASPLATVLGARDKIRALRAQSPSPLANKSVEVILDDGVYASAQTLQFTASDSGTVQYPVTYRARNPLAAAISGGKNLNLAWSAYAPLPGAYVADLGASGLTQTQLDNLNSLFVNGTSATRAREPDVGYYTIVRADPDTSKTYDKTNTFVFDDSNADGQQDILDSWHDLTNVEIVSYATWTESRMPIASVDSATHQVHIQGALTHDWANDYLADYGAIRDANLVQTGETNRTIRYYIENALEGLDTPGEWYLDPSAKQLYYYPRAGETIASASFVVPLLTQLINLTGASNIYFDALTIRDTDWTMPATGQPGEQGGAFLNTTAAIFLDSTTNIGLLNSRVTNSGAYGIQMKLNPATTATTVLNTEFVGNGAGGIIVNVNPNSDNNRLSAVGNHRFALNYIHDNNTVWREGTGIFTGRSGYNRIAANRIDNSTYSAIDVGWFDSDPAAAGHNQILWNSITNFATVLYDGGGIYILGNQPYTAVMGNVISGGLWTANHLARSATTYADGTRTLRPTAPTGIYADETSSGGRIMGNMIYDVNWGILLHQTRDQIVTDNIVVDAKLVAYNLAHTEGTLHAAAPWVQSNVYSWTESLPGPVRLYDSYYWSTPAWFAMNRDIISYGPATIESPNTYGLPYLQSIGKDKQALVTSNPLFVNAAANDFRIRLSAQTSVKQQGFAASWLLEPSAAPANVNIQIEDGSAQRSMITKLTLSFDQPVSLSPEALSLSARGKSIAFSLRSAPAGTFSTTYTLTFAGSGINGDSVPDGAYSLTLNPASIRDAFNQSLSGSTRTFKFHRLFGDINGDRIVNATDASFFKLSLNKPNYVWYLDYNKSGGQIDNADYLELRKRLIKPLL